MNTGTERILVHNEFKQQQLHDNFIEWLQSKVDSIKEEIDIERDIYEEGKVPKKYAKQIIDNLGDKLSKYERVLNEEKERTSNNTNTMKITVNREQLEKKLQSLVGVMAGKSLIPVLDEALIQVTEDKIAITVSDSEITTTSSMPCEVFGEEVFDFVCDIRTVHKTVSLLKSEMFNLEVAEDIIIMSTPKTRKKYEIPRIYPADDFPSADSGEWKEAVQVNGAILTNMIKKAALFINPNDLRIPFTAVHLTSSGDTLKIQGTNGHVMNNNVFKITEGDPFPEYSNILIPKNIMKVISNYERSPKVEVVADNEERSVKISDGVTSTIVRLVAGKYPNIEAVYEEYNRDVYVKLGKEELSMAIKRLAVFSNYTTKSIDIDMKGENAILSSGDTDFKRKGEEILETEDKSELMLFKSRINHAFLSGVIGTMPGDSVYITQPNPKSPFYLVDNGSEGFESVWLIGAMVINEE